MLVNIVYNNTYSYMPWPRNTSDTKNNDNLTAKAKITCLWFAIFSNLLSTGCLPAGVVRY